MKRLFFTICIITVYVYANAQTQWETIRIEGIGTGAATQVLYPDGNNMWAGSTGQIFKSTDGGNTWVAKTKGLQSAISGNTGIVRLGNRVYASFAGNGNYFTYFTTDEGENWNLDTAGWGSTLACIQLHVHGDYVLAKLESNYILYKKNSDAKWSVLPISSSTFRTPGAIYSVGDTLVLPTGFVVALTTDMGQTWTERNVPIVKNKQWSNYIAPLYQDKNNASKLYGKRANAYQEHSNYLMYTNTNQILWSDSLSIPAFIPDSVGINDIYANGSQIIMTLQGSFGKADTLDKVFYSTNGGTNWTNITDNLYSLFKFKFYSAKISVINGKLFAWGIPNEGIAVRNLAVGISELNKNKVSLRLYPNPSTDIINIETPSEKMMIYDYTGKLTLQNNEPSQTKIDISQLQPGVYFLHSYTQNNTVSVGKFIKQ